METNKSISEIIKPLLEHGDISEIAKRHGVTRAHVSRVLHGKANGPEILLSLYEKAKISVDVKDKINSLLRVA
jgi:DNA-binding LacI/PurR family transcriptional regulator